MKLKPKSIFFYLHMINRYRSLYFLMFDLQPTEYFRHIFNSALIPNNDKLVLLLWPEITLVVGLYNIYSRQAVNFCPKKKLTPNSLCVGKLINDKFVKVFRETCFYDDIYWDFLIIPIYIFYCILLW